MYFFILKKGDTEGYYALHRLGLIQGSGYWPSWKHSVLFLENYKMWSHNLLSTEYKGWMPILSPLVVTWSLCVQEHFYLIWPFVIFKIATKNLPKFFVAFILFSIVLKIVIYYLFVGRTGKDIAIAHDFFTFLDLYALGALLGYYAYFNFDKFVSVISRIPMIAKIGFAALVLFALKLDDLFQAFHPISYALWNVFIGFFIIVLLAFFIPQESSFKFSERNIFSRLGKISYSLYLLHMVVTHLLMQFFINYEIQFSNWFNFTVFAVLALSCSIVIGYISYVFFELPFLQLKKRLREVEWLKGI
jgi:peptidoglycan/LPS O-acetylase OafA/YrhL